MRAHVLTAILTMTCLLGCEPQGVKVAQVGPFVVSAETTRVHIIDLESIDATPLEPEFVYGLEGERLAASSAMVLSDGQLIIADAKQDSLFFFDPESAVPVKSIGGSGQGPGEFRRLLGVWSNDDFIVVLEASGDRLQFLNKKGEYHSQISANTIYDYQYALTDSLIYLTHGSRSSKMFERCNLSSIKSGCIEFGDQVTSMSDVDMTYNIAGIAANSLNDIVLAYMTLSYLVVYDSELNMTDILSFKGDVVDALEHPWVTRSPRETGPYPAFFRALSLMDNGTIWIAHKMQIYAIQPNSDGKYELSGRYELPIPAHGIIPDGDRLYISSRVRPAAYRFRNPIYKP